MMTPDQARVIFAPSGVLRASINVGNPVLAYLSAFVEEIKATGLVARLLERHGIQGAAVAPPPPEPIRQTQGKGH